MVTSLSLTEAGEQVRGSSEFNVVHGQPVLDPLNDTSLLVIYNNGKYYQSALSSHLLFLCHPKGLAGDFVYFIEVKALCI